MKTYQIIMNDDLTRRVSVWMRRIPSRRVAQWLAKLREELSRNPFLTVRVEEETLR